MASGFISRGFRGRRTDPAIARRLPPGQYLEQDFPVLTAGPTPLIRMADWSFGVNGQVDETRSWNWDEFLTLPRETFTVDIHCVTKWSKFDTEWEGVSLDTLLSGATETATHIIAHCEGGYTTNLPLEDVLGGKAWIALNFGGEALTPEHGGPARLLVPHLYFWKSAKWIRRIELVDEDRPGFWEELGYHDRGDPWQEQRYQGD